VETPEPPTAPSSSLPGAPPPEAPPGAEPKPKPLGEDRPSTWQPLLYLRLLVLAAALGYAIAFIVENDRQIHVHFVFATARVSLIWEILLLLAVGMLGGVLLSQLYRHRRRVRLEQKARKARHPGADVGRGDEAVGKPR
jgi:uncharacterized membrane protein YciS (DUF1049 family)